jgi:hypothetical protein
MWAGSLLVAHCRTGETRDLAGSDLQRQQPAIPFRKTCCVNQRASLIDPAPRTFFGVPSVRDLNLLDAQVAFLGVPYDGGTPQPGIPTGQRAGPAAARDATEAQFYYPRLGGAGGDQGAEGWYDVEADRDYLVGVRMADVGDVAIQGSDTEGNYERITSAARAVVERGALLVAIGGDHSISYPLGRGLQLLGEFDVVPSTRTPTFSTRWMARVSRARASCGGWRSCRSSAP